MTLTDTLIRSLKANGKIQKKSDGGGLYIHVSPTGGKFWRLAYRRPSDGKQDTLCFGSYDVVSLREAREKRGEAKTLLAKGIDPKEYQK
uniref:Arm DNA-binding domain-containing protein n=1 Tax=Bilophila wadsworthia TaxID=35833 RepID=UPI003FF14A54